MPAHNGTTQKPSFFSLAFLDDLRSRCPLKSVAQETVRLQRDGKRWKGLCPFHAEKTGSFTVFPDNRFKCFGCGAAGDVFDFVEKQHGVKFPEAVEHVASTVGIRLSDTYTPRARPLPSLLPQPAKAPPAEREDWRPMVPPPADAPPPTAAQFRCNMLHTYRGAKGELLCYVRRFEVKGKKRKSFLPLTYGALNGRLGWQPKAPDAPRPLYGLDRLAARPDAPVIICEGEKKADAAQRLFPDWVCVSWMGGKGADRHGDWTPLIGRKTDKIVWPDNDPGGIEAGARIAARLPGAQVLRVDDVAKNGVLGNGGDAADIRPDDPEAWLRDHLPPDPVADMNGFDPTEDGVALAFAARYAEQLRYCHSTGSWYEWTGTNWRPDRTRKAFSWTRKTSRELASVANDQAKTRIGRAAFAAGVERFAQADEGFAVTSTIWDRDPFLLGTPGGTVELRTAELRPARHADYLTKQTAVAPAEAPDCPLWLAFLDQATAGDQELIRFLRQWAGYSLTGDTREHALLFGFGPGGNGKSVFINTVAGIMGSYALTAGMETFTASQHERHSTELARLRGARMVTASETEEGRAWAETRIKQITGGDPITARFMRQDDFTYVPQFKLTIIGNSKPILKNVDEAARRRFYVVPFLNEPSQPDRQLEVKLKAEWPAILRWMIEGCLDWQLHGLVRPKIVTDATAEYFEAQDHFARWLAECCDLIPTASTKPSDLLHSFTQWCQANGEQAPAGKSFKAMIERVRVLRYGATNGVSWVRGVAIRPEKSCGEDAD